MQQRRLRLGDVLDDYCPRERRVANHVVVAMIGDEVKQTRCMTCDTEHEYKRARVPPARRKTVVAAPADVSEGFLRTGLPSEIPPAVDTPPDVDVAPEESLEPPPLPELSSEAEPSAEPEPVAVVATAADEEGPVHRRLIRATLPRPEGQLPERKDPDFTIRQPGARGGREHGGNKGGQRHGRRSMRAPGPSSGPSRFGGSGAGQGPRHGSSHGFRHGSGQRPQGHSPGHGGQRGGGRRKRGR